ncbi:unnamed protein product [Phytomonas sp. EM1]|nr:unnamed protein product [Phytomonas sp. EM1]|eukprot:CCW65376.1 unnamed protein product [Phytomonas sp. isolate EM1]
MWRRTFAALNLGPLPLSVFLRQNSGSEADSQCIQKASKYDLSHVESIVLKSNSSSIHENLTLEEALMRGVRLPKGRNLLLIYRNSPCVVVGRNQNIYSELSVRRAHRERVAIARRSSGGGTVYHDYGNVCFSFITSRDEYAPEKTIQIVRLALCRAYGIDAARLTTTKRYDLFLDGLKITGSAMRVQQSMALHHCTLLVNSNLEQISSYLRPEGKYISFNTTSVPSVRSPVTTLSARGIGGGALDAPDGVQLVEDVVRDFFLSCGRDIICHKVPWELRPHTLQMKHPPSEKEQYVVIDTRRAVLRDETLLNAQGYRATRGECNSFCSELERLSRAEWVFSMPPFTTEVAITTEAYHQAIKEDSLWSSMVCSKLRLSNLTERDLLEELSAILFKETTIECGSSDADEMWSLAMQTVVSHRLITGVRVRRVCSSALLGEAQSAPSPKTVFFDMPTEGNKEQGNEGPCGAVVRPIPWLESFLRTLLMGACCDIKLAGLEDGGTKDCDIEMLLQGLRLEMALTPDWGRLSFLPEDLVDNGLLLMVRGIVKCWRDQNVFDISFT